MPTNSIPENCNRISLYLLFASINGLLIQSKQIPDSLLSTQIRFLFHWFFCRRGWALYSFLSIRTGRSSGSTPSKQWRNTRVIQSTTNRYEANYCFSKKTFGQRKVNLIINVIWKSSMKNIRWNKLWTCEHWLFPGRASFIRRLQHGLPIYDRRRKQSVNFSKVRIVISEDINIDLINLNCENRNWYSSINHTFL